MTSHPPAAPARAAPARDDLTARVFRALYHDYDLHCVHGIHVAVPTGSPCFASPSLGEVARQISDHEHPSPPGHRADQPEEPDGPARPVPATLPQRPQPRPDR